MLAVHRPLMHEEEKAASGIHSGVGVEKPACIRRPDLADEDPGASAGTVIQIVTAVRQELREAAVDDGVTICGRQWLAAGGDQPDRAAGIRRKENRVVAVPGASSRLPCIGQFLDGATLHVDALESPLR